MNSTYHNTVNMSIHFSFSSSGPWCTDRCDAILLQQRFVIGFLDNGNGNKKVPGKIYGKNFNC
jgi:hypothetical protein